VVSGSNWLAKVLHYMRSLVYVSLVASFVKSMHQAVEPSQS
jgi:hypothetical protein